MLERVSSPSYTSSLSYVITSATDSVPSSFSVVSGCHVADVSRSHTPPERDVNSYKSADCMINVDVGSTDENVSPQGVSCSVNSVDDIP